jgi:outer membrane protein, heavy metal efflux system
MTHFGPKTMIIIGLMLGLLAPGIGLNPVLADESQPLADPMLAELENSGILKPFNIFLADSAGTRGDIEDLIIQAIRNNPALRSSFADYQAVYASISQVSGLPDPRLGYTEYLKPVETRVGPQRRAFSLSQSFPWFGSLSLKGEITREKAEAARGSFLNTALGVMTDVRIACYDLGYLEQAARITDQHIGLMTQMEEITRARYSAGSDQYASVIKAQVELGVLLDRQAELQDRRRPLAAVLNGHLNLPPSAAVTIGSLPKPAESPLDLTALSVSMALKNPLLIAWDHRAQASLNAGKLADKEGLPSFSLGVNYIQTGEARMDGVPDSGEDALMASLSVSVPIWRGKHNAASEVAVSQYQGALSSKRNLLNDLSTSLERSHFQFRDASRKFHLYGNSLLPKGRQSLGATRVAYEAGKGSFPDLVDAQRLVLEFELTMVRAKFDVLVQEAVIEKLIAGPITKDK